MQEDHRKNSKTYLALAIAQGITPARWARANDVSKMTAYRWAKEPEVRRAVESFRRRMIDKAVGRMTKLTSWAVDGIAGIAKDAESDWVRLRAFRSIFSDMMTVSAYSGLEARMTQIEEGLRGQPGDETNARTHS
jgi:hypothetical protein